MKHKYALPKRFLAILIVLLNGFFAQAQTDYSVNVIPHQVYVANTPIAFTSDDLYSSIIPLTFDFSYFGTTYNQVIIGTNGDIRFNTSLANTGNAWSFNTTIPNVGFPIKNAILGCFNDMNNNPSVAGNGTITYSVIGSAPYRKFLVLFNNQPAFQCGTSAITTFQMILYETLNTIDVQILQRNPCLTWNGGRAVTGIINSTGAIAFSPPGRNTGPWTASQEGWRFALPVNTSVYNYTACQNSTPGFSDFNLQVVKNDLSNPNLLFYSTLADATSQQNPFASVNYTNETANFQKIYASDGLITKEIVLRTINCTNDYDLDSVPTLDEDLNNDGNFANDDTDSDGIPNFVDNDDDGDMILTSVEYVFPPSTDGVTTNSTNSLDSNGDGTPNYLDNDDDGDGVLTINEDYNGNNNPADDDTNSNGIADYLEQAVALGIAQNTLNNLISVYPNPASNLFHISNKSDEAVVNVAIYAINGALVREIRKPIDTNAIEISDLQTGVYIVRLSTETKSFNCKLIKK